MIGQDIPIISPACPSVTSDWDRLFQLGSVSDTGITDDELQDLLKKLVKCRCGLNMLQDVFELHRCMKRPRVDIIDLTVDF